MRISVTDLDQLSYYRGSEMGLSDLLARLRREDPPSPEMAAGTAFHHVLEHAQVGDALDEFEHDGVRFAFMCDEEITLPPVRELFGSKVYRVDGFDVELRGKVDGLDGKMVWDHKLTNRFDVDRYANAWQWRAYLSIFECDHFRYSLFIRGKARGDGPIPIKEFHAVDFYRYPAMDSDLAGAIREFVNFARVHLPEKFENEVAA